MSTYTQAIRFDHTPKLYPMTTSELYPHNTWVVTQSRRGLEIGLVRSDDRKGVHRRDLNGQVLRVATPEEITQHQHNRKEAEDIKWFLRSKVRSKQLAVKIVAVEFTLDQQLLSVLYSAEERVELNHLIGDLRHITQAKVSFFALNPREHASIVGTLGRCGRESCSSNHLQEYAPVSIRMARDQQLPLNTEKLSGPCGRLLCCLQYEHDMYNEILAEMPRRGAKACHTDSGACGKIGKVNPIRGTVELHTDEGQTIEGKPEDFSRPPKNPAPSND